MNTSSKQHTRGPAPTYTVVIGSGISLAWWARFCGQDWWEYVKRQKIDDWVNDGYQVCHDYNVHHEWAFPDLQEL